MFISHLLFCRETFAFHVQTLKAVGKSLDEDGLAARVHGNTKRLPKHTLSLGNTIELHSIKCRKSCNTKHVVLNSTVWLL